MNETNFCYWLNGFFELTGNNELTKAQVLVVKEHLDLVFNKKTVLSNLITPDLLSPDQLKTIC